VRERCGERKRRKNEERRMKSEARERERERIERVGVVDRPGIDVTLHSTVASGTTLHCTVTVAWSYLREMRGHCVRSH